MPNRWDCLQAALEFRGWGWSVFPLRKKLPAVCYWNSVKEQGAEKAKRVKVTGWSAFQNRRPSEALICRMFEPDFDLTVKLDGVGVVTGPISGGLCVRDFDRPDGYREWARANPGLAGRLPTARTGRGFHVYFYLPPGHGPVYHKFAEGSLSGTVSTTSPSRPPFTRAA